jgi:hypothetical protein
MGSVLTTFVYLKISIIKRFLRGLMNEIENRTTQDYRLIYNYNS